MLAALVKLASTQGRNLLRVLAGLDGHSNGVRTTRRGCGGRGNGVDPGLGVVLVVPAVGRGDVHGLHLLLHAVADGANFLLEALSLDLNLALDALDLFSQVLLLLADKGRLGRLVAAILHLVLELRFLLVEKRVLRIVQDTISVM